MSGDLTDSQIMQATIELLCEVSDRMLALEKQVEALKTAISPEGRQRTSDQSTPREKLQAYLKKQPPLPTRPGP